MRGAEQAAALLALAQRHAGVVTRQQAERAGITPRILASMTATGAVVRLHPGVYVLVGRQQDHAVRCRAALAAAGPGAVVSHWSAAWLFGWLDRPPPDVHVTSTKSHPLRLCGVVVHRSTEAPRTRMASGMACVDPVRALIEVVADAPVHGVDAIVDRALTSGLVPLSRLTAATGSGRRGTARLRRSLVARGIEGAPAPSVLESRMARLLTRAGLPLARAEVVAGPSGRYRLDYGYPQRRLAMEVHGYAWHHTPEQLARDLARHRKLVLDGWTVVTYTWVDVTRHPGRVAAEVRALLGLSPAEAALGRASDVCGALSAP